MQRIINTTLGKNLVKTRKTQDLSVGRFRPWHPLPEPLFTGLHTAFLHRQRPKSITPSIFPCGWSTHAPAASLTATAYCHEFVHITPITPITLTRLGYQTSASACLTTSTAHRCAWYSDEFQWLRCQSYDSKGVTDWFMETICFLPEYSITVYTMCIHLISFSISQRRQQCKPSCSI